MTHAIGSIITLISDAIFLIAVVALLIRTDPTIAAGGLGLIVLGAGLFYRFIRNRSQTWGEISQRGEHARRRFATYSIEGLKELRVSGKQNFFVVKFVFFGPLKFSFVLYLMVNILFILQATDGRRHAWLLW